MDEQSRVEQLKARAEDAEAEEFVQEMLTEAGLPRRPHQTLDFWRHVALMMLMETHNRSRESAAADGRSFPAVGEVRILVPATRAARMATMRGMLEGYVIYEHPTFDIVQRNDEVILGVRPRRGPDEINPDPAPADRVNTCDMDGHP